MQEAKDEKSEIKRKRKKDNQEKRRREIKSETALHIEFTNEGLETFTDMKLSLFLRFIPASEKIIVLIVLYRLI